jgi:hypothetical protein
MTRLQDANWIIICPISECKGRVLFMAKDRMALEQLFNAHIRLKHDDNNEIWNFCTIIKGKVIQNVFQINNKYKTTYQKQS